VPLELIVGAAAPAGATLKMGSNKTAQMVANILTRRNVVLVISSALTCAMSAVRWITVSARS
jgi:hypothetical protein